MFDVLPRFDFLGTFAISLNVETLDMNIPSFWFLCLIIQILTGDHLDAVSADHSSRTIFDLPFGLAKSLSKEKFGGPNILSAVKTPRDLQLQLAKVIVHTDKHMVDNLYSASFGHTLIVAIAMDRKSSVFLPQRLADEGGRLLHDWCLENGMLEEDAEVFVSETVAHWAEMADAA